MPTPIALSSRAGMHGLQVEFCEASPSCSTRNNVCRHWTTAMQASHRSLPIPSSRWPATAAAAATHTAAAAACSQLVSTAKGQGSAPNEVVIAAVLPYHLLLLCMMAMSMATCWYCCAQVVRKGQQGRSDGLLADALALERVAVSHSWWVVTASFSSSPTRFSWGPKLFDVTLVRWRSDPMYIYIYIYINIYIYP